MSTMVSRSYLPINGGLQTINLSLHQRNNGNSVITASNINHSQGYWVNSGGGSLIDIL
jgi:hypothetical protein